MQKTSSPTFQEIIFTLQKYWADQGCVILQPLDTEIGAATFSPATFLRAIGPENVASSLASVQQASLESIIDSIVQTLRAFLAGKYER